MADTVTSQTLLDGERVVVMKFINRSDGTGESLVTKVDPALLEPNRDGLPCLSVAIQRVWYTTSGMDVDLFWDANVDVPIWTISGDGYLDFRSIGQLFNDGEEGDTGKILFSTVGHDNNDRYTIMLEMRKLYERSHA